VERRRQRQMCIRDRSSTVCEWLGKIDSRTNEIGLD
jgi:hypothetical protein